MEKNSKDFLETTLQILDLCGVCPNSQNDDHILWTKKMKHIALGFYPLYLLVSAMIFYYENDRDIFLFIHIVSAVNQWIYHFLVILMPLVNPDAIVRFFQILEETQKVMFSLEITEPVVLSKTMQQCYITFFIALPVISTGCFHYANTFYNTSALIVIITVSMATLIKGKMMLLLIHKNFEALNDRLEIVCKQTLEAIRKDNRYSGDLTFKIHRDKPIPTPKVAFASITVDEIHKFNEAHFRLCDAHRVINELYSVPGIFMPLTACFSFIRMFIVSFDLDFFPMWIIYGSLYMIMFISFLTSASNAKNNSLKTGYLIHELLVEDHPTEIEQELEFFSHILKHRKVQLSAEGFFILDLKILTKIMSTLMPLILILVQRKNRTKTASRKI